jgi:hypothetical protein
MGEFDVSFVIEMVLFLDDFALLHGGLCLLFDLEK